MDPERELIDEQIAYYRARAAEYDATSTPDGDRFEADADRVRAALRAFTARGRVLELAAGTGQWTRILAESAAELVVTDASPEMLSHVPSNRLPAFWAVLDRLLATDGRIFFVDEGPHDEWREDWLDRDAGIVRRPLADGSVHRAIKVLWRAEDLRRRLGDLGWDASITTSGPFYWAIATRGGQSAESTTSRRR